MEPKSKETYWSQFASEYEEKQSYVAGKEVISLTMEELLKEQNLAKVLELGCGTGLYTETLQNRRSPDDREKSPGEKGSQRRASGTQTGLLQRNGSPFYHWQEY